MTHHADFTTTPNNNKKDFKDHQERQEAMLVTTCQETKTLGDVYKGARYLPSLHSSVTDGNSIDPRLVLPLYRVGQLLL